MNSPRPHLAVLSPLVPPVSTGDLNTFVRDLLSLLALPSVWIGRDPRAMVALLLESLAAVLDLDFLHARVLSSDGSRFELARVAGKNVDPETVSEDVHEQLGDELRIQAAACGAVVFRSPTLGRLQICALPLGVHSEKGVLVAGAKRGGFPSCGESLLLQVATNLVTSGLEHAGVLAQLEEVNRALERQSAAASLGAEVAGAFTVGGPLRQILERCCDAIVRHLGGAFARVWTLEPGEMMLELQASAGMYTRTDGAHARMHLGELKVGCIAAERQPFLTNDVPGDPRIGDPAWAEREGIVSFAGYPLIFEGRVLGVIAMFARRPLTSETLASLASVADSIALGVERFRAEQSASLLAMVTKHSHDFIGVANLEGRVLFVNEAGQRLVGLDGLEMVRRTHVLDYFFQEDHAGVNSSLSQGLLEGSHPSAEIRLRHFKTGRPIPVRWDLFTLRDSAGQPSAFATVMHDLTSLKRDADEREALIAQLRQTLAFNELFAGVLGHDLRSPLDAMMMAAQLMLLRRNDESTQRLMERIVVSGHRMARMIEQILDITRIRAGRGLPIEPAEMDFAAVCRDIAGELASTHPGRLELEVAGDTIGVWDADRLGQALSNLLTNALKHGTKGTPVLLRVDGESPEGLRIDIQNEGAVPEDILPVLFEPFRGSPHKRDGSRGLGLGLYITQQIIVGHEGSIKVASSEAEGTLFHIILPRRPSAARPS